MTHHYPDLGSASDWSYRMGNLIQPIRSTAQIWVVTSQWHGISALDSQTSSGRETSCSVAKCGRFLRIALYWIAYFAKMKQSPPPVRYERQWHRTETLCSHSSKIVPELLVERAWCIKFQSLLLRSAYLLPCQWVWVPAPIHLFPLWSEYRFTLWWKVTENYPLVTIHFQDRRGAASFRNQSR